MVVKILLDSSYQEDITALEIVNDKYGVTMFVSALTSQGERQVLLDRLRLPQPHPGGGASHPGEICIILDLNYLVKL